MASGFEKWGFALLVFAVILIIIGILVYIFLNDTFNNIFWAGFAIAAAGVLLYLIGSILLIVAESKKRRLEEQEVYKQN